MGLKSKPKKEKYQASPDEKYQEMVGAETARRGSMLANTAITGLTAEANRDRTQEFQNIAAADTMQATTGGRPQNIAMNLDLGKTAEDTKRLFDAARIGQLTATQTSDKIRKAALDLGNKQATSASQGFGQLARLSAQNTIGDMRNQQNLRGAIAGAVMKPLGAIYSNIQDPASTWYGGNKPGGGG